MKPPCQKLLTLLPALLLFLSGCETYPRQQGPGLGLGLFGPSPQMISGQQWSVHQDYENTLAEVSQLRAENQRLRQLLNPPATRQALPSQPGPDLSPLPPAGVREINGQNQPGSTLPVESLPTLDEPTSSAIEPLSTLGNRSSGSPVIEPLEAEELTGEWAARHRTRNSPAASPRLASPLPVGQVPSPASDATQDFPVNESWQR